MTAKKKRLVIGTRGSALALWQAGWVRDRLAEAWPEMDVAVEVLSTTGDLILDRPLPEIGGKGLFTEELERALLEGGIDIAVHSLKDLPVESPGLAVGAIPVRADPRDVFVSARHARLADLPPGASVGTSSLRRGAQLLMRRPDLELLSLRGNVDTRLDKAMTGDYDAIVLAAAGVLRLGKADRISSYLPFGEMLPAPGQGALGIQCRERDEATVALLASLDHADTRSSVVAERSFLLGLGGGCSAPIAALATVGAGGGIDLEGLVASPDGQACVRVRGSGHEGRELGMRLAEEALSRGAKALLA